MTNRPNIPAMIFAAGFGTRMQALTKATPKPLLRVGNRALIDYGYQLVQSQGLAPIYVNAHYHSCLLYTSDAADD